MSRRPASRKAIERALRHLADDRRAVEAWAASPSRKRTLRSLEREAKERMPGVDIDAVHKRNR